MTSFCQLTITFTQTQSLFTCSLIFAVKQPSKMNRKPNNGRTEQPEPKATLFACWKRLRALPCEGEGAIFSSLPMAHACSLFLPHYPCGIGVTREATGKGMRMEQPSTSHGPAAAAAAARFEFR